MNERIQDMDGDDLEPHMEGLTLWLRTRRARSRSPLRPGNGTGAERNGTNNGHRNGSFGRANLLNDEENGPTPRAWAPEKHANLFRVWGARPLLSADQAFEANPLGAKWKVDDSKTMGYLCLLGALCRAGLDLLWSTQGRPFVSPLHGINTLAKT